MNDATHCLIETRRNLIRRKSGNGLDYVEVGDVGGHFGGGVQSQTYLTVYFLGRLHTPVADGEADEWLLSAANFRITGGRRITDIQIIDALVVRPIATDEDDVLVLRLDRAGDFSCYTLEIREAPHGTQSVREGNPEKHRRCHARPTDDVLRHFDQRYRSVDFSFKADCPSTLDCASGENCAVAANPPPTINYLAKDYAGFRELILDRLALTLPDWRERHVPDIGIALTEILAYAADHLSYYQDAVAQEAYLDTARRRISVRRHLRLVDYFLHEGCNSRAWVRIDPQTPMVIEPDFALLTQTEDETAKPLVFEPVKRQRGNCLEIGDFYDLRQFAWTLNQGGLPSVASRLSPKLRQEIKIWLTGGVEKPLPRALSEHLVQALNRRVLGDPTFAAADVPVGNKPLILSTNRAAFDTLCHPHCVPLHGISLHPAHAKMRVHAWHNADCCLEKGAIGCVLVDHWATLAVITPPGQNTDTCAPPPPVIKPPRTRTLRLRVGDVIVFEEILGPLTGSPNDADPSRRHAVRLTAVVPEIDALTGTPLVRVCWVAADALPVSFCLSKMGPPPDCKWLNPITVVRGNIVLADHGESQAPDELGTVESDEIERRCRCVGVLDEISVRALPFYPDLDTPDLTFATPLRALPSATASLAQKPWQAVPHLSVASLPPLPDGSGPVLTWEETALLAAGEPGWLPDYPARQRAIQNLLSAADQDGWMEHGPNLAEANWTAALDLLDSGAEDRNFVVEMDNQRHAWLRFGDGKLGRLPAAGETFRSRYRIGNGPMGNVGHESITVFRQADGRISDEFQVINPLAAAGGSLPETLDHARRNAPHVFRLKQLRAVTGDDYARLAEKNPRVQRAGAEIRWTGSRQSVRVALDPLGTTEELPELTAEVRDALLEFRRIGHDLQVIPALYATVDLALAICVKPDSLRGAVEAAARDALTSGLRRDGTPGFFHPDRLTFGEPVRISRIIAAVQNLPGVMSVRVTALHRWGGHPCGELENGYLAVGPLEVARLDQDPDFPENGTLTLTFGGGR